jgi:hypothetical protein
MRIVGLLIVLFAWWFTVPSPVAAGDARDGRREYERMWTTCAKENQRCRLPYAAQVRYGADGAYVYRQMRAGHFACNNATFGDPLVGREKHCAYQVSTARHETIPERDRKWVTCAEEGERCFVPYSTMVRYGANGVYVTQLFTVYETSIDKELGQTDFICGNAKFGDPLRGQVKHCEYEVLPSRHPLWVRCAYENEFCAFEGGHDVRFGSLDKYAELRFTKSVKGVMCSARIFGDPVPGKKKYCEVYR